MAGTPRAARRRLASLHRPQSFASSLRAPALRAGELRLHFRTLVDSDQVDPGAACVIGFVLPKRYCKHAVRRNMIRRVFRARLRERLAELPTDIADIAPVLVLRLAERFPAEFSSADSPPLRRHVAALGDELIGRVLARLAPREG